MKRLLIGLLALVLFLWTRAPAHAVLATFANYTSTCSSPNLYPGNATLVCNTPSGVQANDAMYFVVARAIGIAGDAFNTPVAGAGSTGAWQLMKQDQTLNGYENIAIYRKCASGTPGGGEATTQSETWTLVTGSGGAAVGGIVAVRGSGCPTAPEDQAALGVPGFSATPLTPGLAGMTATANEWTLRFFATTAATSTLAAPAGEDATDITVQPVTSPVAKGLIVSHKLIAGAGSTIGSAVGSSTVSTNYESVTITIQPAVSLSGPTTGQAVSPNMVKTGCTQFGNSGPFKICSPTTTGALWGAGDGCTSADMCQAWDTDDANACARGQAPVAGGTNGVGCLVIKPANSSSWIEARSSPGGGGPSGLVADATGITGTVSGTAGTKLVTWSNTHATTCSGNSGARIVTVTGYTLTQADLGKHIIVGCPTSLDNTGSFPTGNVCAGGTNGKPIRAIITSVSGQNATMGTPVGSSPTLLQATVTNADCEIGTDNTPAVKALVLKGSPVHFTAGRYLMDGPAVHLITGTRISCDPGAVLVFGKNDQYDDGTSPTFGSRAMFYSFSSSDNNIQITGPCQFIGTNTIFQQNVNYNRDGGCGWNPFIRYYGDTSCGTNNYATCNFTSNITTGGISPSAPMVMMNNWSCDSLDYSGVSNSTAQNLIFANDWVTGIGLIQGGGNTFNNITMMDTGQDVEPNTSNQACTTANNTFTNLVSVNDGFGAYSSVQTSDSISGSTACNSAATNSQCPSGGGNLCSTGQHVNGIKVYGNTQAFSGASSWANALLCTNPTGTPICRQGNCGTVNGAGC